LAEWRQSNAPLEAAASLIAEALQDTPSPRIAIPGGSAAAALPALRDRMGEQWKRTTLTFVDERCVAIEHPDSNHGLARRTGALEGCAVVPLWKDGDTPDRAIARFEAQWSGLDAIVLGMGGDGHVASLFVGFAWPDGVLAFVPDSPKPPPERMTLTLAALATASTTIVLALGEGKRDALERLHRRDRALPASALDPIIVTDLHPKDESND